MLMSSLCLQAQIKNNSELYLTLKMQDSIFFERGFNQCDMDYLEIHIAENLKFYHDQSGFQDRLAFFENTKKYICSNSTQKPIRKVDTGSLEVFPLYNNGNLYGAIQNGTHHFYLRENGKEDLLTSTAKFTSVWVLKDEIWKISEVLSYDHQDQAKEKSINEIEKLLQDNNVPALGIGIIKNGKLIKIEVSGTLDKQTTAPFNTIFRVASLTKPIVALITLKLIDKGLLDMDEPLYKYWIDPDINNDKRYKKLTPKIILTHQTGFPNWRWMNEEGKLGFQFDPGTEHQYSGEVLFDPLEMSDTHFWWDSEMDENRYAQNFNGKGEQIETSKYYTANAAANLLTTIEDYGKFLEYVINGADLSPHLFQEMLQHQVKLKDGDYFGLGWEILTEFPNNDFALLHSGRDPGVSTLAVWFPKSKNGYLVFMNGDNVMNIYEELLINRFYQGSDLWNKR